MIEGLNMVLLVLAVPAAAFGLLVALGRFEARMVEPGERAAVLADLLLSQREPEEVEAEVAAFLRPVVSGARHPG